MLSFVFPFFPSFTPLAAFLNGCFHGHMFTVRFPVCVPGVRLCPLCAVGKQWLNVCAEMKFPLLSLPPRRFHSSQFIPKQSLLF